MPKISVEDKHLTVLNLFTTDAAEKQDQLIQEMTKIVKAAAYDGWMNSTVHSGIDSFGTANFIQWRSGEDLEKRYEGEEFKHRTLPVFGEITTSIRLLQNEVAFAVTHPSLNGEIEVSPNLDNYTVIAVYTVEEENQAELIDALGEGQKGMADAPGFRANVVLKGLRSRGCIEGSFVVTYQQWADKAAYDAHRDQAEDTWPVGRQKAAARIKAVVKTHDENTYKVVLTRGAGEE